MPNITSSTARLTVISSDRRQLSKRRDEWIGGGFPRLNSETANWSECRAT